MIFEIIIIILTLIGAFSLCVAERYHYFDLGYSERCIISIIIGIALLFIPTTLFYVIPHNENCTCSECIKYVGNEQGLALYMNKNKEIYYIDKNNNEYVKVIQNDDTSYTYNEYLQNQLNEMK